MHAPEEWKQAHLGELVIESALRNSKGELGEFDLRSVNKFEGMIPMKERVKGKSTDRCKVVKNGWFAYNPMRINIGSICQWQNKKDCLVSPDYVVFRCRDKILDPCFMNQFRQSSSWQNFMNNAGNGSVRVRIYMKDLASLKLPLPSLPEQQKIAQILSTWDNAIAKLEALIAAKKKRKKALMQQLLTGKKRFSGFEEEWEWVRLGDTAQLNSGGTPSSIVSEYYDGDIPWVSIADMTKHGKFIFSTERNITNLGLENSSARIYPKNTILYAMYASIGECSIAKVELSSSQAILGIRPNAALDYLFLYFYLSSLKDKIKLQGQHGTQANLNAGMVKDFRFKLPPLEEQQKIASVLSAADTEIETHQKQLTALKQQKKGLMQQLLTGKKRVQMEMEV